MSTSHELFSVLSCAIARDAAGTGFSGTIAIGIRLEPRDAWLSVKAGWPASVSSSFGPEAPKADALLFMGEEEATCLVRGAPLPHSPLLRKQGDEALMRRFLDRYLIERSTLDVRVASMKRR